MNYHNYRREAIKKEMNERLEERHWHGNQGKNPGENLQDEKSITIGDYKQLTIRKRYQNRTVKYTVFLVGVFFVILMAMCLTRFYNPAVLFFLGFVGIGAFLSVIDLLWLKNATKRFDSYVRKLSCEDLRRIEKYTKVFGYTKQLVFLEKEMINLEESILSAYAYSDIAYIKESGNMVELYDSNDHKLGWVFEKGMDLTGNPMKRRTASVLQNMENIQ